MRILWWSGWWWLEHDWIMTFHILGNVIIPTDELIFFRGVGIPPTRNASEADAISATENSWWAIDASIRFKLSPKELVIARLQGAYCKTSNQPGARLQGLSHHKPSSFRFGIRLYPTFTRWKTHGQTRQWSTLLRLSTAKFCRSLWSFQ